MKRIGLVSTAALSLFLGLAIPAFTQEPQDKREEPKAKQDEKKQEEKPLKQEEQKTQQEKNTNQEQKNAQQENKNVQQQDRNNKPEEKNAQQRAGTGRIPDDRYRAHFGREHTFRVNQTDFRDRRFQYGGYWFGFAGVWPSNWLYTQDVFVVEINGVYYLCNANYPGVNIELSVTL